LPKYSDNILCEVRHVLADAEWKMTTVDHLKVKYVTAYLVPRPDRIFNRCQDIMPPDEHCNRNTWDFLDVNEWGNLLTVEVALSVEVFSVFLEPRHHVVLCIV
jgi:hypothetical protein